MHYKKIAILICFISWAHGMFVPKEGYQRAYVASCSALPEDMGAFFRLFANPSDYGYFEGNLGGRVEIFKPEDKKFVKQTIHSLIDLPEGAVIKLEMTKTIYYDQGYYCKRAEFNTCWIRERSILRQVFMLESREIVDKPTFLIIGEIITGPSEERVSYRFSPISLSCGFAQEDALKQFISHGMIMPPVIAVLYREINGQGRHLVLTDRSFGKYFFLGRASQLDPNQLVVSSVPTDEAIAIDPPKSDIQIIYLSPY